ncbi:MAG TPA: type III secretion system stator protein SctL [Anaeromyxobacteraceae bacterium]|nr:type III secretion system stator protein SctL [Anaeromyxobacteraceae bacterium]
MAAVLKRSTPGSGRWIPAVAHEAARRAAALLERAEAEAATLRARAEAEGEEARAEAREAGRREGLAAAGAALAGAALERERILAAAEREVVALAIEVARKILGRELATDPAAALHLAAAALRNARGRRQATLRVHPSDAPAIREGEARLSPLVPVAPGLAVEEDPGLSPGDVVVETEAGRIDARIETQLESLRLALEESIR